MHQALLYTKEDNLKVQCKLCRHHCRIGIDQSGLCHVRVNKEGELYSIFYGKPVAMGVDPIEKKPLYHYYPGSQSFSIATLGCNFKCSFCQNWNISQYDPKHSPQVVEEVSPEKVVAHAKANRCQSISYTYTEPTIFFEYALDCAKLAKENNIGNNFVTNGYMTREAIDLIRPYLDAANVDLKAFRKDTYRKLIGAQLDGVCDSIKYLKENGVWLEVTTLIIPGVNDDPAELKDLASFLVEVGRDIPWHVSRFYPGYQITDIPPTPVETLRKAYEIGKKVGLRYIYLGNVKEPAMERTYCYKCNEILIERSGYSVESNSISEKSQCPSCKAEIDGIGMKG
ncbi:MAG: AmmeMemoRadiSam system radical SAM enzyme [Pseudomonadota bacterium]